MFLLCGLICIFPEMWPSRGPGFLFTKTFVKNETNLLTRDNKQDNMGPVTVATFNETHLRASKRKADATK